ncbi:hypothetical protein BC830DRAFT_1173027 [Chytriomyces sp. MP71]|nr:hypothetical protein BC830DRAFT_1173027 [Chytriomyces sp. MP71]
MDQAGSNNKVAPLVDPSKAGKFRIRTLEVVNKEVFNKEKVNKETVNKETVNKETANKEVVNKEVVNKEVVNKDNKEVVNKVVNLLINRGPQHPPPLPPLLRIFVDESQTATTSTITSTSPTTTTSTTDYGVLLGASLLSATANTKTATTTISMIPLKSDCQAIRNAGWCGAAGCPGDNACCELDGVICNENKIISVVLPGHNLTGSLPMNIAQLHSLTTIDLSHNSLTGGIPDAWGLLSSIVYVKLDHNALSGELPASLAGWKNIQFLYLNDNNITGTYPDNLDASTLVTLNLDDTLIGGILPSSVALVYKAKNNCLAEALPVNPLCPPPVTIANTTDTIKSLPSTGGLGVGAIIGIAAGGILLFLILATSIYFSRRNAADSRSSKAAPLKPEEFAKVWICRHHKQRKHHVFISYRVDPDAPIAEKLFYLLDEPKKRVVYLDKKCLNDGENWQEGFLTGLKNSEAIVFLISYASVRMMASKAAKGIQDNVVLEMEEALKQEETRAFKIVPIFLALEEGTTIREFDFSWIYAEDLKGTLAQEVLGKLLKKQAIKVQPGLLDVFVERIKQACELKRTARRPLVHGAGQPAVSNGCLVDCEFRCARARERPDGDKQNCARPEAWMGENGAEKGNLRQFNLAYSDQQSVCGRVESADERRLVHSMAGVGVASVAPPLSASLLSPLPDE